MKGEEAAGGIAGYNKADGRIVRCTVMGEVIAVNRTGGICGENKGTIQDCVNESTVNGEDLEATLNLNGMDLGQLNLTQNVVTRNDSGGIAGRSGGSIVGCTNRGTIGYAHVGYNVGGIVGRQDGTVIECENEGAILGRKDVGGIVGQAEPYRESEYLSDRLEKLQDDLGRMNSLVVQMSDALSRTSREASAYTKTLQRQYEDTVDSLNREVNYLRDSISEDREETRGYIDSISQALENMSEIGNDTVNRVMDQVNSTINDVNRTVNDVREEVKDRIDQEMDKIDKDKIDLPDLKPGGEKEDGEDEKEDGDREPSDKGSSGSGDGGNSPSGEGNNGGDSSAGGSSGNGSSGGGNNESDSSAGGSSGDGSSGGGNNGGGSSSGGNSGDGSLAGGSSGSGSSGGGNDESDSSVGQNSGDGSSSGGNGGDGSSAGGSSENGSSSGENNAGDSSAGGNSGSGSLSGRNNESDSSAGENSGDGSSGGGNNAGDSSEGGRRRNSLSGGENHESGSSDGGSSGVSLFNEGKRENGSSAGGNNTNGSPSEENKESDSSREGDRKIGSSDGGSDSSREGNSISASGRENRASMSAISYRGKKQEGSEQTMENGKNAWLIEGKCDDTLYTDNCAQPEKDSIHKGGHAAQNVGEMPAVWSSSTEFSISKDMPQLLDCTASGGSGGEDGASSGDGNSQEKLDSSKEDPSREDSPKEDTPSEDKPQDTPSEPSVPDLDIDRDKLEEELEKAEEGFTRKDYIRTEPDPEIKNNLNKMRDEISGISGSMKGMYDSISSGEESMGDAAGNISNELADQSKLSGETIDELTDSVDNGIQSMTSSLNGLMSTQQRIRDSVGEDLDILMGNEEADLDVSSENIEKRTQGVIAGCMNYGEIQADLNLGGIAGIMNVEYDISPEMDLDLTGLTDITVRSTTYNVLIHCINYGKVTAKKNFCGGIVGNEQLGLVYDCENYGNVRTENGVRAGGIAGISTSSIRDSYAFCNISGSDYLGGISGDGYDISGCAAICRIESDGGECIGSIAGRVDEEAVVSGNFFSSDRWEGIDNISYFGRAEGRSYEELMEMGMPQGFTMVTVTFEMDEEEIGTLQIPYGGSVEEEDVPSPGLENGYLSWECEFPIRGVTENITVEAQEHDWITSLASPDTDDREKTVFLVEGKFYADASLELTQCAQEKEGAAYAYNWSITGEVLGENDYIGHFLIPEGADKVEVWLLSEGTWHRSDTKRDGNYVTAPIAAGEGFAVCPTEEDATVYLMAGCAVLAAAVLMALIIRRKRKKRHTTGKEE